MNKILCILLIAALLSNCSRLYAQEIEIEIVKEKDEQEHFNRHNLSLYSLGGISTLLYGTTFGDNADIGFGGGGGLGYGVNFIPQFGIFIGAEVMTLQANFYSNTPIFEKSNALLAGDNVSFQVTNLQAQQSALLLNVPLLLHSHLRLNDNYQFYIAAGVKFGFAFLEQSMTKIKGGTSVDGTDYLDTHNGFGIDRTLNERIKFRLNYGFNLNFSVETGIRKKITDILYLYAGVYADYGVFDMRPQSNEELPLVVEGEGALPVGINNFFTSKYINTGVHPFGVGVKIRFDIDVVALHKQSSVRRKERYAARLEEQEKRAEEKRKRAEANRPVDHDSRLIVSVRNALTQGILPSSVMVSNRATVKGENADSALTEVGKNVHRLRINQLGDYYISVNVDVPPDIKKTLDAFRDSAADANANKSEDPPLAKGTGRIKVMLRDMNSGAPIRSAMVKLLDQKTLMFVDVLVRPDADGSFMVNLPEEFNGYLTFHIGGRTLASFQNSVSDKDKDDADDSSDSKLDNKIKRTAGKRITAPTIRGGATARTRQQPVVRHVNAPVITSNTPVPTPVARSGIGGLAEYLSNTFSNYTLRVRRFFVGNQVRQQVEIQATQ
jgi:hypothetical protein